MYLSKKLQRNERKNTELKMMKGWSAISTRVNSSRTAFISQPADSKLWYVGIVSLLGIVVLVADFRLFRCS